MTLGASASAVILSQEVQNTYLLAGEVTTLPDENRCVICHGQLGWSDSVGAFALHLQD